MRKPARAYRDFYQKHEKEAANAAQEQEKHWLNKIFFGLLRLFFILKSLICIRPLTLGRHIQKLKFQRYCDKMDIDYA